MKTSILVFVVLILVSLPSVVVYTQNGGPRPILISFTQRPVNRMRLTDKHVIDVTLVNKFDDKLVDGILVFTLNTHQQISENDVLFSYEGQGIRPEVVEGSLLFVLPEIAFGSSQTDSVSVEVIYNKPGVYRWSIALSIDS